jgi:toxin ParE1/3/4
MAEVIWTEPALSDLDAIADYITPDRPEAAKALVQRVFSHVEQLQAHPESGSLVRELPDSPQRQIMELPCRIFYRVDGQKGSELHLMRGDMQLHARML